MNIRLPKPGRLTRFAVLTACLLAGGCGYHLRGTGSPHVGLDNVYLEGGSDALRDQFKKAVNSATAKSATSADNAAIVITVLGDSMGSRVLSLSERGRYNEYELDYFLDYQLKKGGKILLAGHPIRIRREYYNDQVDIIAKANEENIIRNEIYQQAIVSLVERARIVLAENSK